MKTSGLLVHYLKYTTVLNKEYNLDIYLKKMWK